MEGKIINYRRGRRSVTNNQIVVTLDEITTKEDAEKLVGKNITWTSPAGKELVGKVSAAHGNKGNVRALMSTGMPGQSVGQKVLIA